MATEKQKQSSVVLGDKSDVDVQLERADGNPNAKAPLTLSICVATFFMVMHSFNFGWANGVPNLTRPAMYEVFGLTDFWWSWIVSIYGAGGVIGGLLGGPITSTFGPKWTTMGNGLVWIAAGLIMAFAPTGPGAAGIAMLMVGRLLCGIGAGIGCASVPPYVADISPVNVRGAMGCMHQLFIVIGILFSTLLTLESVCGNVDLWFVGWGFFIVPAVINWGMFFFPESPRFLYNKGKEAEAADAMRRLRGPTFDVEAELEQYYVDKKKEEANGTMSILAGVRALFTSRFSKQTTISLVLQLAQQLSGINAIMFYSGTILAAANIEPELGVIMINAFFVIATVAAVPAIETLGRRFLLLIGFGAMGVFLVAVCVGLALGWQWPSVIFLTLGVASFAVGPGPIPWMIGSEVLPPSVRPAGVSLSVALNWGSTFVVSQVYPYMVTGLGSYSLLPFAVFCLATVVFAFFFVPETSGKSMAEIDAIFGNN